MGKFVTALAVLIAFLLVSGVAESGTVVKSKAEEITLTGRVHTQFRTTSVEGSPGSEFLLRRARFAAVVKINEYLSGKVQPDFGGGGLSLKDAYLKWKMSQNVAVVAGKFFRPFDLFEFTSSTQTLVIERDGVVPDAPGFVSYSSLTEDLDYSDRDTGVMAVWSNDDGQAGFQFAITNGPEGGDGGSDVGKKQFTGRFQIEPATASDLMLGISISSAPIMVDADTTEYSTAFAIDGELGNFESGVHVQAGVTFGDNWSTDPSNPAGFVAIQAIASVKRLVDGGGQVSAIEPLIRVSWADPDTDTDNDDGVLVTPGIQVHLSGRNKLAANVDVFIPGADGVDSASSFKVQSYLHF